MMMQNASNTCPPLIDSLWTKVLLWLCWSGCEFTSIRGAEKGPDFLAAASFAHMAPPSIDGTGAERGLLTSTVE